MSTTTRSQQATSATRATRLAQIAVGVLVGASLAFAGGELYHSISTPAKVAAAHAAHGYAVHDLGAAPNLGGFTDQTGNAFDPTTLRGKVQVVSFLDPRGTRVSPVIAVNLLMAVENDLKATGTFGKDVVFVTLNVDPQASDPATTAGFLQRVVGFGKAPATAAQWPFLSASATRVAQIVRHGYGVPYRRLGGAALRSYASQRKATGSYFYASAWNPLAEDGLPTVVGNGTLVIVGPQGHIRARIPRAYQVSSASVEQTIDTVLAKTGH